MPQALKILCLAQVGRVPFSHFQPSCLWCNKNWPPSMKVKKLENMGNKIGLICCKWSSLNAPGTNKPLSCSGWENSIFSFSALWGNKKWNYPRLNGLKSLHGICECRGKHIFVNRAHFSKNRGITQPTAEFVLRNQVL